MECIAAVHRVVPHTPLMLDVNCAFRSIDAALAFCRTVGGTGEDGDAAVTDGGRFGSSVLFVEEPLWPPEDVKSLGVLRTTLIDATPPVASLARTSAPTPAAAMSALSTPVKSAPISPAEASATSMRRMRIAAGENLGSAHEFAALLDAGAVDLAQPSVTKVEWPKPHMLEVFFQHVRTVLSL